jgi:hypothetical protein
MGKAEIGVHFTMDQVLIGCAQLTGKQAVENFNNFLVAFHIGFIISLQDVSLSDGLRRVYNNASDFILLGLAVKLIFLY